MTEGLNICGYFDIEVIDSLSGKKIDEIHFKNQLMAINQTARVKQLLGTYDYSQDDFQIKYIAFGNGATTPTPNDTQLTNEIYRKQITQVLNTSAGVVQSVCSIGADELNTSIKEIGVFAGSSATSETGSGLLIAHSLFDYTKTNNVILNIVRSDVCTMGG